MDRKTVARFGRDIYYSKLFVGSCKIFPLIQGSENRIQDQSKILMGKAWYVVYEVLRLLGLPASTIPEPVASVHWYVKTV